MKRHLHLGRRGHWTASGHGRAKFPLLNRGDGFFVEPQAEAANDPNIRDAAVHIHVDGEQHAALVTRAARFIRVLRLFGVQQLRLLGDTERFIGNRAVA